MRSFRRHLASFGLALALLHLTMQVIVPAALCCERSAAASKASVGECCPPGSHPPGLCPMHASKARFRGSSNCQAGPVADLHDLLIALTTGGVLPAPAEAPAPAGVHAMPAPAVSSPLAISSSPPGPPPRV